jgi:DNA polymerase
MMAKSVTRDLHKMHAFVRFRKHIAEHGQEHYFAWHRPDHRIVRAAAPFFVERFGPMRWSILTPDESAHWDTKELTFSAGVLSNPIGSDALEDIWKTYYANTFNPARLSVRAMKKELPVRHWKTLPESELIPSLIKESGARTKNMIQEQSRSALEYLPAVRTLDNLREAVQHCQGCALYKNATQAIFGHGPADARIVFVGEQPGDNEDLTGKPFVGPAGQLLDRAFAEVGIARESVYMTGAVRHFKHELVGKQRIHKNPNRAEIAACRPWILEELRILQPRMIVCLGVSAAVSILGRQVTLRDWRGRFFTCSIAEETFVTAHPAAILRAGDDAAQAAAYKLWLDDLRQVAERAAHLELLEISRPGS